MNETRDKKCLIDSSVRQPRLSSGLIQRTLLLIPGWIAPAKQANTTISECSGHSCVVVVYLFTLERRVVLCCQQHYQLSAGRVCHSHCLDTRDTSINNLHQFLETCFVTQVANRSNFLPCYDHPCRLYSQKMGNLH